MIFEPQYYSCRVGITKVGALITTFDDIYDVYGSLDELKVFTHAVKRWDISAVEYMPEFLQVGFLALYNTINEMGYDTLIAQGKNIIPILAKVWGELSEAFFVEAKWNHNNYKPTLEDYLDNAWRSDEMDRGKSVNAISCYMHEHDVSEEVASEYIKTLIDKAWMKMIKARVLCSEDFADDPFIDMAINLARISHCTYQYGDGYGAPDARAKDRVLSVIFEPVRGKEH
ncbi:hypothetical protein L1987_06222 [Smallanthus sonchifolius]|uniref:Uncharacterized protein n=1 Tax=Smallanthus sonchifolius TaxID=185202 RepID=A0ACB9JXI7_9ASTR|nr:hypothetical protein L1987_06222 [Smallanthus sonchifolius]